MNRQHTFTMQQIADEVKKTHPNFGVKKLFKMLRDKHIIYKVGNNNYPTDQYVKAGYLRKHISTYRNTITGTELERPKPVVTEAGAGWLFEIIHKELNQQEDKAA